EVLRTPLAAYACPSDPRAGRFFIGDYYYNADLAEAATNSYAACHGGYDGTYYAGVETGNGLFWRNSQVRLADVRDGTSATVAVGERAALFARAPWAGVVTGGTLRTTPDAPVYLSDTLPPPYMVLAKFGIRPLNTRDAQLYDFFSPHPAACLFVFADGA